MTWTLILPLTRPLSLNDRTHYMVKAKQVSSLRRAVHVLARAQNIPHLEKAHVTLHYQPRDKRRRDSDSLVATLKPAIDGIVDAGVIPDDTPEYVSWEPPIIHPPAPKARQGALWLTVQPR